MPVRSPHEEHRSATALELFFDLVFVVAVAKASGELHHAVSADHIGQGVLSYTMVFFAIWWAWMNFSWFASSYDTDDVPYRLVVFVQMVGALMLAAGVGDAFAGNWQTVAYGFVVMRGAMVFQWARAAVHHPEGRQAAIRYAVGIATMQVAWLMMLRLPASYVLPAFALFVAGELAVPVWAMRVTPIQIWHTEHIVERYGLFTIIVLGEAILATSFAIDVATDNAATLADLAPTVAGGLLVVFALWWLYFGRRMDDRLDGKRSVFLWGYGHYLVFASGAAVGAGLGVLLDLDTGQTAIGAVAAGYALAIPVAIFLMSLWTLHLRPGNSPVQQFTLPIAAIAVLAMPFTPEVALGTGATVAAALAFKLFRYYRARSAAVEVAGGRC
jgi:low temperature requirement protein LtrA